MNRNRRYCWPARWIRLAILGLLTCSIASIGCTDNKTQGAQEASEEATQQASEGAEPSSPQDEAMAKTTHVPSPAPAEKMRYIVVNDAKVDEGRELYARCAGCHGMKAEGKVGTAPRLDSRTFLEAASDDFLVETIMSGREGTTMIPWGDQLEKSQAEAIVAYLRSLQPTEAAELDHSELTGDPNKGERTFDICARCHGDHGGGYQESAPGTGIARKGFLATTTNGFLRYVIFHGKSQTPMRSFHEDAPKAVADLSEDEVENVIAFMRHNAW